jgi:2-epi-5-epi-valiolone synthase
MQIGVDVGGTKTRVGIVDNNLSLVSYRQSQTLQFTSCGVSTTGTQENGFIVFATPTLKRYPDSSVGTLQRILVEYISQAVNKIQEGVPPGTIHSGAVSFAGLVKDNAIIIKAADLYCGWGTWDEAGSDSLLQEEFFLKDQLEKKNPNIIWFVVNDVIAATLRYACLPRYQQIQTLALLTVSTGIGYAIFDRSATPFGDEDLVSLGHRTVDFSREALECDCGGRGHLATYFSGKAVETRVREHASRNLQAFVHSSLYPLLLARFSNMSVEERREQFQSSALAAMMQTNITLTSGILTAFLHKSSLSIGDVNENTNDAFLLAMMVTNREIVMAINRKDALVMGCMHEMMEKFSLGFQEILNRGPEKIVVMGGFVLAIKDVFLEMLIEHMSKGSERKEIQADLQERIDWALGDDLDGVIGSLCAHQHRDESSQGGVIRSIDSHGSTVFELQAHTKKTTSSIRTCHVFSPSNAVLRNVLTKKGGIAPKVFVVTDTRLSSELEEKIRGYFQASAISCNLYQIANAAAISMEDVEALLRAAKTFNVGRRDYFLAVGCSTTLHCGGLAAAIYRRGIPHILIPLDDPEGLATSPHTVNLDARETSVCVSNFHPPEAIVLDETLNEYANQIQPAIKSTFLTDQYSVVFGNNLFDPPNTTLSSYLSGNTTFVVVSEAADIIYGEMIQQYLNVHRIQYRYTVYAGGETNKYFPEVLDLVRQIQVGRDPREMLICIGGGVTLDLAGFAAALTQRRYIRIPTTLLGAIDAGIGVKTGCNYQGSKNFLGDFYAPVVCLNDVFFLKTVALRDVRAGLAEILKMGIVRDPEIVHILEAFPSRLISERFQVGKYARRLLELATYWMLNELQANLHEDKTLKRLVDFGHAFSPFLEIKSHHRILHGEAVAIDMALCTELSYIQRCCTWETRQRILNVLVAVGLPVFDDVCEAEGLLQSLRDIRLARAGNLHLPIPERLGRMVFIEHVSRDDLEQAVTSLRMLHETTRKKALLLSPQPPSNRKPQQLLA